MSKKEGVKKGEKPQAKADNAKPERKKITKEEAVKMEKWLTEKYGEDDEEYLDRLDEYEAMLEKEYELPKMVGDGDNLPERLAELYEGMTYAQKDEFLRLTGNN